MKLLNSGNVTIFQADGPGTVIDSIGKGVYEIFNGKDQFGVIYTKNKFDLPEKIYGKRHDDLAKLIGNAQLESTSSVGCLLLGLKGSGKTITMKHIANKCIEHRDYTVFVLDQYYPKQLIEMLADSANGKCVFYIDEFGKKFSDRSHSADESEEAESLLELLNCETLKDCLFLLADNDSDKISNYLLDRPERITFLCEFGSLADDTAEELIEEIDVPEIAGWLKYYTKQVRSKLSFDVFSTVIRVAKEHTELSELIGILSYYNVPLPEWRYPKVVRYYSEGEEADLKCPYEFIFNEIDRSVTIMKGNEVEDVVNTDTTHGGYTIAYVDQDSPGNLASIKVTNLPKREFPNMRTFLSAL